VNVGPLATLKYHGKIGTVGICYQRVHKGRPGIAMKTQPRYSKEEFARRGDSIYENELRPILENGNEGKFVAIDIETAAYEVDGDQLAASDRLRARVPDAQIWVRRIGSRYARHFGSYPRSAAA
jgi:hypothetical protein